MMLTWTEAKPGLQYRTNDQVATTCLRELRNEE